MKVIVSCVTIALLYRFRVGLKVTQGHWNW